jgi:hypothetical protein
MATMAVLRRDPILRIDEIPALEDVLSRGRLAALSPDPGGELGESIVVGGALSRQLGLVLR